ncbi:2-dehydropantoate 2-reductase [Pseudoflavitalea sp. G-6-1-2]|uniref:ketopantoate reductase family protein n=1 Tax=Pseudoflavitalea sp. G-6-1-2 TaxID=2728841 RepID=UPI00146EAA37|nr:2-dehydropantoate 2-reductase [Pseudoflavitalea sp. G-6-1-2]NML20683.1 2-dehydropantoate 2-reductase [Pseudoflavitalea sp. G-6-1-2]
MKPIYIIGTGAIGKTLAVALRLQNRNVMLLRGSVQQAEPVTQRIQVAYKEEQLLEADIDIKTLQSVDQLDGIVVLTNKSYGNQQLSETLKSKIGNSPVVLLQNGLGVERAFIERGYTQVYRCVLFVTCQQTGDHSVKYKPVAVSPIGIEKGDDAQLTEIVQHLNSNYFEFKVEKEIQSVIWKKAIANSVFNSICPLLETDNGIFHRNDAVMAMASRIIAECLEIAHAKGIQLTQQEVESSILQISKFSDGQLISTLQDIRAGRETEIETLNFEIARIAEELGKAALVKETKLLGELTLQKSKLSTTQPRRSVVSA